MRSGIGEGGHWWIDCKVDACISDGNCNYKLSPILTWEIVSDCVLWRQDHPSSRAQEPTDRTSGLGPYHDRGYIQNELTWLLETDDGDVGTVIRALPAAASWYL